MLLTRELEIKWTNKIKRYYINKGYKYTNNNYKFIIKVEDLPKGSHIKVDVKCDCCGKEYKSKYYAYIQSLHDDGKVYCQKCVSKLPETRNKMSKNHADFRGEKSPHWNFNLTDKEREMQRNTLENKEFIKRVLARDNYTCKCCGKQNTRLEVHHLDGYDWCKEKRYDEINGIALCKNCHKNFHMKYGKGKNTKEQFEEWIGKIIDRLDEYNDKLPTAKPIYCIEEDKVYYGGALEIKEKWKLKSHTIIYDVCNKKKRDKKRKNKKGEVYIQIYCPSTVKGKHLLWYKDYLKGEMN